MNKIITTIALAASISLGAYAQREHTPVLDRGVVAVKTSKGVFCSWRIPGQEYYDVTYNIYRDGTKLNDKPLETSNFEDPAGELTSTYTVTAVVRGVEQEASPAAEVWANNYLEIVPTHDWTDVVLEPNDATVADLDGDGELEVIIKFVNNTYHGTGCSPKANCGFDIIEAYKLNGKRLWWIDCGPNMTDFQSNEINIACFDWDGDGKAECVMRAADRTVVHKADGTDVMIGDPNVDTRNIILGGTNQFTFSGGEYLLYFNGETADLYVNEPYPLKRLEDGEDNLEKAWGDGYGHRSSKHFFGAPYFDGQKPSIFLARGIYTRHKMIAYDVDPATHKLSVRWSWANNQWGPWYGQGYHNYTVADVDWDGRDEIVFGSMVIDDNGKGLSSTDLGHGDAHHVSDFNPYIHGSEFFGCNEDKAGNNYRDATTSKIYYRQVAGGDDGRAICGNFTDAIIGACGTSAKDGGTVIGCVHNAHVPGVTATGVSTNFRIYWDGDLCEETFDAPDKNMAGQIQKQGTWNAVTVLTGSITNNDTKKTPCHQADMFGDWREEVIMRDAKNHIRIYTTTIPTKWRNYSLLDDHQYRNAIVHQMNGYNQPPHTSYFLGEAEGITVAPPPFIMTGRVRAEGSISSDLNDKHVVVYGNEDATISVGKDVSPYILTINTPSWVQGNFDNNNIKYEYFTHTFTGEAFTGDMRLVKQGDGVLKLPKVTQTYTGNTDVWAGTFDFDGTMESSPVWLNRFAVLQSNGGVFKKVSADYAAEITPAGKDKAGSISFETLELNFGSKLSIDLFANRKTSDTLYVKKLIVNKAPNAKFDVLPFTTPVLALNLHPAAGSDMMPAGKYCIAKIDELEGRIEDITIDGASGNKCHLVFENGTLYLEVVDLRPAATIYWVGDVNSTWDLGETWNFVDEKGNKTYFVSGDEVVFDDRAVSKNVVIAEPISPASVSFVSDKVQYVVSGDSIVGECELNIEGEAPVTINNINRYTGGTSVNGGTLIVKTLAYVEGIPYGAVGAVGANIALSNSTLSISGNVSCSNVISCLGVNKINVPGGMTLKMSTGIVAYNKAEWQKVGAGTLSLAEEKSSGTLRLIEGVVNAGEAGGVQSTPPTVYLEGGQLYDANNSYSYTTGSSNIIVPEGKTAFWRLDSRCDYRGSLSGAGNITIEVPWVRCVNYGDWSDFSGNITIKGGNTLYFLNGNGLEKASVRLESGMATSSPSSAGLTDPSVHVRFGNLDGTANIDCVPSSCTYYIGYLDKDINYSGVINGGKITKVGSGLWTIKSVQNVAANSVVNVNGGVMNIKTNDYSNKCFGTASVAVASGATFAGLGYVGNVTVNEGATIAPGDYTASTVVKSLKVDQLNVRGGTMRFFIRNMSNASTSRSYFNITSILNIQSAKIEVNAADAICPDGANFESAFAAGDTVTLWTAKTAMITKEDVKIEKLPVLPAGLIWDTSKLLTKEGILVVIKDPATDVADAISTVFAASESVDVMVFDLNGVVVSRFSALRSDVENRARQGLDNGLYVVRMSQGNMFESIKILVD